MTKPLSLDLRCRVLAAVASGLSHRQAGERFGVSAASVSRWRALERDTGTAKARAMGGDQRSKGTEAHGALILQLYEATRDITLDELRAALREHGVGIGYGGLWRFFHRRRITFKKSRRTRPSRTVSTSSGRARHGSTAKSTSTPERLIFVDETSTSTKMARPRGRAPRGHRLRMGVPHGHWKTTTLTAGLSLRGIVAPFVLDGAVDRLAFETYVARVLAPELRPGDIVIMDNLPAHKGPRVAALIEAAGARLLHLPPYSPDFNPIENAFAKLKALLRKAAERTVAGLWAAIGRLVDLITPAECANMFRAAGYDAD